MEELIEDSNDSTIRDRWDNILRVRGQIVTELDQMANDLPGVGRKYLRSLSRWFKGPANFEEALRRPDVLAICLPLTKSDATPDGEGSSSDFGQAVRLGFFSRGPNAAGGRHLVRIMLYPLLILAASLVLVVAFSCGIAPQFQEMYEEFGIELPGMTKLVFWVCDFVQQWWWAVLLGPPVVAFCLLMMNRIGRDARPGNLSWLDQRMMSTRYACASWVWHVSLLLEAGFTQDEAVVTASDSTGNPWLRQVGHAFDSGGTTLLEPQLFLNPKFHLAGATMQLPASKGKILLLREVAAYYWDRNRNVGDWWIHWLNASILWLVGLAIVFAVAALFMPMLGIISGLTGSKF